jgi:hypothetical protein
VDFFSRPYLGAAPEYGKKSFLERLEREIERAKKRYPEAKLVGIADGAESNWKFLEKQTEAAIPNSKLDSSENLIPRGLYNS